MPYESARASSSPVLDLLSFKRQQTVFILLNLLLLLVLVLMHGSLSAYWNQPSLGLISVAVAVFLIRMPELLSTLIWS